MIALGVMETTGLPIAASRTGASLATACPTTSSKGAAQAEKEPGGCFHPGHQVSSWGRTGMRPGQAVSLWVEVRVRPDEGNQGQRELWGSLCVK